MDNTSGEIRGVVSDSSGQPIQEAVVMIGDDSPPHPDIAQITGSDGAYSLLDLIPGKYSIVIQAPEGKKVIQTTEVNGGESVKLDISVED